MKTNTLTLMAGAALVLAGCASSGGSNSGFPTTYDGNVRDGVKTTYSEVENGMAVFQGNPDGTVSEFFVRMSADKSTLYVSKDGGEEVEFTGSPTYDNGNYLYGYYYNTDGDRFYLYTNSGDTNAWSQSLAVGDTHDSYGYGGLETDVADLPDNATYSGSFNTYTPDGNYMVSTNTSDMAVDFANGDITGTHSGYFYQGTSGSVSGDITGTTVGSRMSGELSVTGAATGTLDFGGMAQGAGASNLVGGVAGTVTDGNDAEFTGGGHWNANQIAN